MEGFFGDSTIPAVLGIVLIIWFGIIAYMFFVDNKLNKIEKKLDILNEDKDLLG